MNELNSADISEWMAYDSLEPIGKWRDDYRTALLASVITNLFISTYGKKGTRHTEIKDFLLNWDIEDVITKPAQSMEEMKVILQSLTKTKFPTIKSRKDLKK